ncbi:co-chaperone HscB [Pantoea sp. 1.19]|uniref:co-chaperone HscB n=1 Tax=Pantoea sp. 1.19 TaxID=1925589 RepID=UPI000948AB88|nr:co-chaperone HscB [Pantoea sp. 1.19]
MDYFTLFGLPQSWDIDAAALTSRFQELQRQYHPDRFATESESVRLQAVQQAATLNQGYQALRSPLPRAEYLLSLHGFDINNEQHTMRDAAFLMEQLELREELEAMAQRKDAAALGGLIARVSAMATARETELRDALAASQWAQGADTVRKLRFLAKLRSQAEALEEQLLDF